MLERLGHEPEEEEEFTWDDLEFTVSSVENGKVEKMLVKWVTPELEIDTSASSESEEETEEKGGDE